MLARNGAGPASATTDHEALEVVRFASDEASSQKTPPRQPIRAELTGSDPNWMPAGRPALAICRRLERRTIRNWRGAA